MNRSDDFYPEHWRALSVEKEAMPQPLRRSPRVGHHHVDPLTARERQIVRVIAEGLTNKEIAQRLRLAEGTVKVHLHRIYRKLGIGNRTTLAILAHTNSAKQVH